MRYQEPHDQNRPRNGETLTSTTAGTAPTRRRGQYLPGTAACPASHAGSREPPCLRRTAVWVGADDQGGHDESACRLSGGCPRTRAHETDAGIAAFPAAPATGSSLREHALWALLDSLERAPHGDVTGCAANPQLTPRLLDHSLKEEKILYPRADGGGRPAAGLPPALVIGRQEASPPGAPPLLTRMAR